MTTPLAGTRYGLEFGTPPIRSTGPIAFGPDGILFIADNASASIIAVDTRDTGTPASGPLEVDQLATRLAAFLGCATDDVYLRDMAVHPVSRAVYLSVMRGTGDSGLPVIVRVDGSGQLSELSLEGVPFARHEIGDAPALDDPRRDARLATGNDGEDYKLPDGSTIRVARDPLRSATITDLAYIDGTLMVAGASNEEFASTLRRIPFPFAGGEESRSLEIFHVSHGKYETASPIRTFLPFDSNRSLLASYTCTPVVHFSLADMDSASQLKGRTVAELGARNTPLDMLSYERGGEEFLLVSNTTHPLLKIPAKSVPGQAALTTPTEPVGVPREALPHKRVSRMANLGDDYVLMLQEDDGGSLALHSYPASSL
jgi:hypothetical protein